MQHTDLHQSIIDCLRTNYGINVSNIINLSIGADINASIYKVEAHDHSCYFVKLKYGNDKDNSSIIFELLHNAKIQQIIFPITTLNNRYTQRMDNFSLIVYPFIEGQDGFCRSLSEEQWMIFGETLKQIHRLAVPTSIQKLLRHETYSSKWREIVRSLYRKIIVMPIKNEITLKMVTFMKTHLMTIKRLVNHAEELAQGLKSASTQLELVLCHSDIHGGNVLIDSKGAIYIVDWDETMMAPKERDLMFIGGGVGNVWNIPSEIALFYKGYGNTAINLQMLAYYRFERIVEDIAIYAQQFLSNTVGTERLQESYQHFVNMLEPQGVIDIAFATIQR